MNKKIEIKDLIKDLNDYLGTIEEYRCIEIDVDNFHFDAHDDVILLCVKGVDNINLHINGLNLLIRQP